MVDIAFIFTLIIKLNYSYKNSFGGIIVSIYLLWNLWSNIIFVFLYKLLVISIWILDNTINV